MWWICVQLTVFADTLYLNCIKSIQGIKIKLMPENFIHNWRTSTGSNTSNICSGRFRGCCSPPPRSCIPTPAPRDCEGGEEFSNANKYITDNFKSGNSAVFIYICNTLQKSLENLPRHAAHQQVHLHLLYFWCRSLHSHKKIIEP